MENAQTDGLICVTWWKEDFKYLFKIFRIIV